MALSEIAIKIIADILEIPIILYKYNLDEQNKQRYDPAWGKNSEEIEDEDCI